MNKNYISLLLVLLATIVVGTFVYFKKLDKSKESVSVIGLVPQGFTSEIIEINFPYQKLEELFNTNLIWKEIEETSKLKRLADFWNQDDSIFNTIKVDAIKLVSFVEEETQDEYYVMEFEEVPKDFKSNTWNQKVIHDFLLLSKSKDFSHFNPIKSGKKLLDPDSEFTEVYDSRGKGEGKTNVFQKEKGYWLVFDLTFLPEQIFTNGFVKNNRGDSKSNSKIDLTVFDLIPYQFKSLKLIHFDSISQLRKDQSYIDLREKQCDCDINFDAYNWIETPSVFFKSQYQDASYTLFKLTSISDFKASINNMLPDSLRKEDEDNSVIRFFGNAFDYNSIFKTNMKYNYFVRVDDYVMFAEKQLHLERLLFQQFSDFTITKKADLNAFLNNNIDEKSREVTISGGLNHWEFDLKSGIGISQSHIESDALIYKSLLYSKEINLDGGKTNPKWNIEFENDLRETIFMVKNHRTNDKDYIVQDLKNTIYFITPNGDIKWKRNIGNPIVGGIKNIDILGNDKYQLIFNTKNQLYILDVLGRNVNNFPVKILDSATANVSVMDYDKDLNFRFLVPTTKGVKSINKQGEIVTGWMQPKQENSVVSTINHLLINGLDYIQVQDSKGKLYFYNRKGEVRHHVAAIFNNKMNILYGSSIEQTRVVYLDTSTNSIKRQFFSKKPVSVLLSPNQKIKDFHFIDFDGDKNSDFVLVFENEIKIYGQDLIIKKRIELPANINQFHIWENGYGYLNQFGDFTVMQGEELKVIEGANAYQIDFYKNKVRAILKGENNLKLLYI
ncbi:MAG: hypothetical protein ABF242_10640 [Flavobacteriales bacterium]